VPIRIMFFLILLSISDSAPYISAADNTYSLILNEYGEDSDGEQTQTLVRYRFKAGVMASREPIITALNKDFHFRFGSQVYRNRYVISSFGDVFDLVSKQILLKSRGDLIYLKGDSIVIRVNRTNESGYFAFNLSTHEYSRIEKNGFWKDPSFFCTSEVSPNGQTRASGCNDGLWLQFRDGRRKQLESKFSSEGTVECSDLYKPPFIWADDDHILTQLTNGHLVRVDLAGNVEPLLTTPVFDPPVCGPEFRRDGDNRIYYEATNEAWLIDTTKRTSEPYLWKAQGDGFEIEFQRNAAYGRIIRYLHREIGRLWCDSASTTTGHIALQFCPVGSNLVCRDGVKVWSSENSQWTTIKVAFLAGIVGWISE
jgi:hypothetical protein